MRAHWDVYFDETSPKEYRLLSFHQYRQQQEDFTFSFQREASRLRKSLVGRKEELCQSDIAKL
jgi:hypothetical protein